MRVTLEDRPGTYALLLRVSRRRQVRVGALGELDVAPGPYVYVGSALGPGGVRARVSRHASGGGVRHWHVDHLRAIADLEHAWIAHGGRRLECAWASALERRAGVASPFPGFGASDCACRTHLFRLDAFDLRRIPDVLGPAALHPTLHEEVTR